MADFVRLPARSGGHMKGHRIAITLALAGALVAALPPEARAQRGAVHPAGRSVAVAVPRGVGISHPIAPVGPRYGYYPYRGYYPYGGYGYPAYRYAYPCCGYGYPWFGV